MESAHGTHEYADNGQQKPKDRWLVSATLPSLAERVSARSEEHLECHQVMDGPCLMGAPDWDDMLELQSVVGPSHSAFTPYPGYPICSPTL